MVPKRNKAKQNRTNQNKTESPIYDKAITESTRHIAQVPIAGITAVVPYHLVKSSTHRQISCI